MSSDLVDDLADCRRHHREAHAGLRIGVIGEESESSPWVCFAYLPPSPPSKTRYLVKRLRAALPEVGIIVGRWAPPALADESTQVLRETGSESRGCDAVGDPRRPGRPREDPEDPASRGQSV